MPKIVQLLSDEVKTQVRPLYQLSPLSIPPHKSI